MTGMCKYPWMLGLTVLSLGCVPEIHQDEIPATIEAQFDPSAEPSPKIPSPTDLIYDAEEGRLDLDLESGDSPAQEDLVGYLNSLDGWPASMPASATFLGEIDASTVDGTTVRVLDITDLEDPAWVDDVAMTLEPQEDGEQEILVHPGLLPTWEVGHRYAIAILGGESGVRGMDGQQVVSSPTFWFFKASSPLARCEDQDALTGCESLTDLVDDEDVADLEEVRRDTVEVFDALERMGIPREEIALAWSFRTSTRTVVPFDPSIDDVHFPNDYYMSEDETHLDVPPPPGTTPEAEALLQRLNQKDGYSLTAPGWMRFVGPLEPAAWNLTSTSLLVVNADEDEDLPLLQRQWDERRSEVLLIPYKALHDHTRYAAVALDYLEDVNGERIISSHIWSILKSHHPAADEEGHSLLSSVDDETASDLEEARQEYEELFEELEGISYPREKTMAGVVFTTQSVVARMQALRQLPFDESLDTEARSTEGVEDPAGAVPAGFPQDHLSGVVRGTIPLMDVLDPDTRELETDAWSVVTVPFTLTLPDAPPEGRASPPVVLFFHDLDGSREDVFAVADVLAERGYATFAMDLLGHGERGTCIEDADCDAGTCNAGKCVGGTLRVDPEGRPLNARSVLVPVNSPFAAGDAMRQMALDLVCAARALGADDGPGSLAGVELDVGDISFFGVGFGAMAGAIFMAVDPTVQVAVLTGAGGNLGRLVSTSDAFEGEMDAWLQDDLGLEPGGEADHFFRYAWSWASDPGDPGVFAHHLMVSPLPDPDGGGTMPVRDLLVQVPMLDDTIPELNMRFFWLSAGRDLYPVFYEDSDNGFILDLDDETGDLAREQAADYIATGGETVTGG